MSQEKHIHIVSFDVPFPANYGGVIDVFYKIKYLNEAGVKVHLHCFQYGRPKSLELEAICFSVDYYPRKTSVKNQLSFWPYIVKSRLSERLVENLLKDDYPILFEGMHTMGVGLDQRLSKRKKIYRESNIEHHYYKHLAKAERNLLKKLYHHIESFKLKRFEKYVSEFDATLLVSKADYDYFDKYYKGLFIKYLPSFHPNNDIISEEGTGEYALYNGNLSVAENISAVNFLLDEVFSKTDYKLIVAGLNPGTNLIQKIEKYPNVELRANLSNQEMGELIKNAHLNILVTFQATGLKLKLLSTLYQGRFCVVNDKMTKGTGLSDLCILANNANEILNVIKRTQNQEFDQALMDKRDLVLSQLYNNKKNVEDLIHLI